MKKSYKITISEDDKFLLSIKIRYLQNNNNLEINKFLKQEHILNQNENKLLTYYKNKINLPYYNKYWDIFKKYSNDYELIHNTNSRFKGNQNSIANYNPLSRSYYKLWEIISDFNLLDYNYNIKTVHIAEGPGGFVEAVVNYRKKHKFFNDQVFGMTLKSFDRGIPGWKKSESFLNKNKNVSITYGKDGTGNIYILHNILHLKGVIGGNNCEFITGDGGFDFSEDFNNQEQLSYQLIFCQIIIALTVQKKGGTFVCKFFDSYSLLTVKFLWLLNNAYKSVIITKPLTSRPANSEKYIVCQNFQGIDSNYLESLYTVVDNWNNLNKGSFIIDIFGQDVPDYYIKIIEDNNNFILFHQLKNIIKTLKLIKWNYQNNEKIKKELVDSYIIKNQINKATTWCLKYNIDINLKCHLISEKHKEIIYQYLKSKFI